MDPIKDLLSVLCAHLPAENQNHQSFYTFIEGRLASFEAQLEKIDNGDAVLLVKEEMKGDATKRRFINLIRSINKECLDILRLSYLGDILHASEKLRKLLYTSTITGRYINDLYINYFNFKRDIETYYRCRKLKNGVTPDNCWHLPFNMKDFASCNRFNQVGTICIYFADSPQAALGSVGGKRANEEAWIGTYKPIDKDKISFLGIIVPTDKEIEEMNNYDEFSLLITYPFLLLCLTKCKNAGARFHEEYLFSQLLFHLLFITEANDYFYFNGICYTAMYDKRALDFVIPARYSPQNPPANNRSPYLDEIFAEVKSPFKM